MTYVIHIVRQQQQQQAQFICSACGAERGCQCDAPAIPKITLAAKAIKASPGKSDRAIAEEIGVGHATVSRARETVSHETIDEPRIGLDGKTRRQPAKRKRRLTGVQCYRMRHRAEIAEAKAKAISPASPPPPAPAPSPPPEPTPQVELRTQLRRLLGFARNRPDPIVLADISGAMLSELQRFLEDLQQVRLQEPHSGEARADVT